MIFIPEYVVVWITSPTFPKARAFSQVSAYLTEAASCQKSPRRAPFWIQLVRPRRAVPCPWDGTHQLSV